MGCDIHTQSEKLVDGRWQKVDFEPFDQRHYGMFGFLADVRNYSRVPPICAARGLPRDYVRDEWDAFIDYHSCSYLTVTELAGHDYEAVFENRRVCREVSPGFWNGAALCEPGEGEIVSLREFLGESFFDDLRRLQALGIDRVVFGFDS